MSQEIKYDFFAGRIRGRDFAPSLSLSLLQVDQQQWGAIIRLHMVSSVNGLRWRNREEWNRNWTVNWFLCRFASHLELRSFTGTWCCSWGQRTHNSFHSLLQAGDRCDITSDSTFLYSNQLCVPSAVVQAYWEPWTPYSYCALRVKLRMTAAGRGL